jgi:hypothetical protein
MDKKSKKPVKISPTLTIRNLTSTPVTVRGIGRFVGEGGGSNVLNAAARFTTNFTSIFGVTVPGSKPASATIVENVEPIAYEETTVHIDGL